MNREKLTGKRTKLHVKLTIIALVLISIIIILNACPPLEEDPISNTIIVTEELDQTKWMEILFDIHERGIPVNLDLSACTPVHVSDVLRRSHEDGEPWTPTTGVNEWDDYVQFDPLPGFPYGKELIRTLILPKAATMIRNATDIYDTKPILLDDDKEKSAFRHFTNLRSITGENIRLIGTLAFFDCKSLEEANFSRAVHIMQYAFYGCTSLKEAHFEVARDLHISSFENCTNLEKAIFPYAGVISERAFKNCGRLTEVNFDVATRVGDEAFRDCISLRYARFRANPDRTTGGHPLQPYLAYLASNPKPPKPPRPFVNDSVVFFNSAFRGCKFLEVLDVRYAWNVYFAGGALADIGEHLELFLFDDGGIPGGKSYGHPQTDMYLGDIEESKTDNGAVTLKSIIIWAPVIKSPDPPDPEIEYKSQIENVNGGIYHYIRNRYSYDSGKKDEEGKPILSYYIDVTVQRGPAL